MEGGVDLQLELDEIIRWETLGLINLRWEESKIHQGSVLITIRDLFRQPTGTGRGQWFNGTRNIET